MTLPVKRRKYDAPRIIKGPINQRKRPIVLDIRQGPIQPTDRSLIPTASASSIPSANRRAGNIVRAVGDSTTKLIQNMPPVSKRNNGTHRGILDHFGRPFERSVRSIAVMAMPFYRSAARPPQTAGAILNPMADVRPFRALRYAPGLDLSKAICPPFDIISPERQRALHERSPYNAVHIELAYDDNGSRYERAAEAIRRWREDGTLVRDEPPAFYLYDQQFEREGVPYRRRLLFARLRLETWDRGIVLPHEQTFGAPKEDRLRLLRAIRTNTSPVFLI